MEFEHFSHNGKLLPVSDAVVPLASIEYSYGFGVYENIRVASGRVRFLDQHCTRLRASADIIGLEHRFKPSEIERYVTDLVSANEVKTCNIKILLIGGKTAESADLYIMCLAPFFVNRKLYKTGCHCITYRYERSFPQAKTLNMLPSFLAYRDAVKAGAHDALLINHSGDITEGTRSNFFALKGATIYSPPSSEILPGVTRNHVLELVKKQGLAIIHQSIPLNSLDNYDAAFLTSTSAKILPIGSIDTHSFNPIAPELLALSRAFDKSY